MIKTLALSILILAVAALLFGVKIIFKRGGMFSSMHIHDSKAMRDRGIKCVIEQDFEARNKADAVKEKK